MRGLINLLIFFAKGIPGLITVNIPLTKKISVFLEYLKISFKLFTLNKIKSLKKEKFLGFQMETFDYGALHFLFGEIFFKNCYLFSSAKKDPFIFDCGSNIGMSIFYFKWLFPNSKITAFEPDPDTFNLLKRNIEKNKLKNVYLNNIALSDKDDKISFYIDDENPGWLTMSSFKERLPKKHITVHAGKLSKFIKDNIDFLKMDIEGAERKVLEDLQQAGKIRFIKKMYIEFHNGLEKSGLFRLELVLSKSGYKYLKDKELPEDVQGDIGIYAEK